METNLEVEEIVNEIKNNFYNIIKSKEFIIRNKKIPINLVFKSIYNPDFDLFTDNIDLIITDMFKNTYLLFQCNDNFIIEGYNRSIKIYLEVDKEITHKHFFKKNTTEIVKVQQPYYLGSFDFIHNNLEGITTMNFKPYNTSKLTIVSNDKFKTVEYFTKSESKPLPITNENNKKEDDKWWLYAAIITSNINRSY